MSDEQVNAEPQPSCMHVLVVCVGLALALSPRASAAGNGNHQAEHAQTALKELPQVAAMNFALERAVVVLRLSDPQEREVRRIHDTITDNLRLKLITWNAQYAQALADIECEFEQVVATSPFYQIKPYSDQFDNMDKTEQSRLMRYHMIRQMRQLGKTIRLSASGLPPDLQEKVNLVHKTIGEPVRSATDNARRQFFLRMESVLSETQLARLTEAANAYHIGLDARGQYAKRQSTKVVESLLDVRAWLDGRIPLPAHAPSPMVEWRETIAASTFDVRALELQQLTREYERAWCLLRNERGSRGSSVLAQQIRQIRWLCASVEAILVQHDSALARQWRDATNNVVFHQAYANWTPLDITAMDGVAAVVARNPDVDKMLRDVVMRYGIEAKRIERRLINDVIAIATAATNKHEAQRQMQETLILAKNLNQRYRREVERFIQAMSKQRKEIDTCLSMQDAS